MRALLAKRDAQCLDACRLTGCLHDPDAADLAPIGIGCQSTWQVSGGPGGGAWVICHRKPNS